MAFQGSSERPNRGWRWKETCFDLDHLASSKGTLRDTCRISVPPLFFYHYGAFETPHATGSYSISSVDAQMSAAKVFFFMRWTAADGGGKWVELSGSIIICFGNGGLVGGGGGGGGFLWHLGSRRRWMRHADFVIRGIDAAADAVVLPWWRGGREVVEG
jgi:hypothetical protein